MPSNEACSLESLSSPALNTFFYVPRPVRPRVHLIFPPPFIIPENISPLARNMQVNMARGGVSAERKKENRQPKRGMGEEDRVRGATPTVGVAGLGTRVVKRYR